MARLKEPSQTTQLKEVRLPGSFAPNGGSAVAASSNRGAGFSVVRTSQGLFTLTFDEDFAQYRLVSASGTLQHVTAIARWVQFGTYSQSARTLQVRVVDGSGNVQDVTADADSRVNFVLVFAKGDNDF